MVPLKVIRIIKANRFFKNTFRNYSVELCSEKNEEKLNSFVHPYKKAYTKSELLDFLVKNVVYNKDGIIVTNKPYGISIKTKESKTVNQNLQNYIPQTFNDLSLEEVSPGLADALGEKMVIPVMVPEKLSSGVTIYATSENAKTNFNVGLQRSKSRFELPYTYLTVTMDKPVQNVHNAKFGITYKDVLNVVDSWSQNSVKRNEVKVVFWKHQVLSSSKFCSLVKVKLSNPDWKSLRLYLAAKCYSPVLGDALFSSRIAKLMGVPLPTTLTVKEVPNFDSELLAVLKLSEREAKIIPNHVHLWSFSCSIRKYEDLFVSVPPPESFIWTCNNLDLRYLDFIK